MSESKIRLDDITIDGSTQMRESMDADDVNELAEHYKAGKTTPAPVVFWDGNHYWPGDGHHRISGHRSAGLDEIVVEVREGTKRDAILYAAGANADHGIKRTNGDKRKAVATLLRDKEWGQWSDRVIAEKCNVGHQLVASVRSQISTGFSSSPPENSRRISADGRSRPATQPDRADESPTERIRCANCIRKGNFRDGCEGCAAAAAEAIKKPKPSRATAVVDLPKPVPKVRVADQYDETPIHQAFADLTLAFNARFEELGGDANWERLEELMPSVWAAYEAWRLSA